MTNAIARALQERTPHNGRHHLVAIDGRGGSGKSSLLDWLAGAHPDWVSVAGDDWFEPVAGEDAWGAYGEDRFARDVLLPLARGDTAFRVRPYDWAEQRIVDQGLVEVPEGGVVVIERCAAFELPVEWDLRVWVETPREECLRRGLERDGHLGERAAVAWTSTWQPREDELIARTRPSEHADLVLDGTRPWSDQIDA